MQSAIHPSRFYRVILNSEIIKPASDQRREARRRQKLRQKNSERGSGSADATEMCNDENLLANPEEEKPDPPSDFDEEAFMQKVVAFHHII